MSLCLSLCLSLCFSLCLYATYYETYYVYAAVVVVIIIIYILDRLCGMISIPREAVPRSRSEAVLKIIKDAAIKSANAGRPFLTLCSLIDPRGAAVISNDEFITILKMMECNLTRTELDAVRDILPPLNDANKANSHIDYRALYHLISQHPNAAEGKGLAVVPVYGFTTGMAPSPQPTTLNVHSQSIGLNQHQHQSEQQTQNERLVGKMMVATNPSSSSSSSSSSSQVVIHTLNDNDKETENIIIKDVMSRINQRVADMNQTWTTPYSLRHQFEIHDRGVTGRVSVPRFEGVLDDMGIKLLPSELRAILAQYSAVEDPQKIYYLPFCPDSISPSIHPTLPSRPGTTATISSSSSRVVPSTSMQQLNQSGVRPSRYPLHADSPMFQTYPTSGLSPAPGYSLPSALLPNASITATARVVNRFKELRESGVDLMRAFSVYDPHSLGMVKQHAYSTLPCHTACMSSCRILS